MAEQIYLAVDLGASSGRVLAGIFDGARLRLEEVHRFENGAVNVAGSLNWDLLGLWSQVQQGLRRGATQYAGAVKSVGVDAWGVDFGLLGRDDVLLGNPCSYRDRRTQGMLDYALERVSREEIFAHTGLQFMEINTLFQLLSMRVNSSPLLDVAKRLLLIPDLFHWLLTGEKANEITNATTTQFFDPVRRTWAHELLHKLDLPGNLLGMLVEPGTNLGTLRADVATETGLAGVEVVLPGTHDTASAVMAVPARQGPQAQPDWCYISSGTWSLLGAETPEPVMSEKCLELTFTNEGGVGGTVRLLKNIAGLWLLQECRRCWARQGKELSWEQLNELSTRAAPLAALINPDGPDFQAPPDMPQAIRDFSTRSGQSPPADEGAMVRCILESLALKYRYVLGALEELIGGAINTIHIVGGGTQNRQLCQATADACQRPVLAGPIEATAIGNVMMQAIAAGAVGSIAEARRIIRDSFPLQHYEPGDGAAWDEAYAKFVTLL